MTCACWCLNLGGRMHWYMSFQALARLHQNETLLNERHISIRSGSLRSPHALAISHSGLRYSSTPRTFLHNPIPGSAQSIGTSYYFNYVIHPLRKPQSSQFPPPPHPLLFSSISAAIFSLFLQFLSLLMIIPTVLESKPVHISRPLRFSQWLTVSFRHIINNLLPVFWPSLGILQHK